MRTKIIWVGRVLWPSAPVIDTKIALRPGAVRRQALSGFTHLFLALSITFFWVPVFLHDFDGVMPVIWWVFLSLAYLCGTIRPEPAEVGLPDNDVSSWEI